MREREGLEQCIMGLGHVESRGEMAGNHGKDTRQHRPTAWRTYHEQTYKKHSHTQTHLTPNVLNCFKDYTKIVFTFRIMPRILLNRRPTLQSCCLSYTDDTMPADALAPKVARAQFQKRSTCDRLRYDPVILIVRSHSTNGDHDQLIRSRKYATKQFIANWIMT